MRSNGVFNPLIYSIALCSLIMGTFGLAMAQSSQDILNSSLVFKGTVKRLQATTMKAVASSPNTIVVKVDTVLRTTDPSSDYTGKEITLYANDPNSLKVGDKAVFYTQGWLLEESVAVRELKHTKLNATGVISSVISKDILTAIQTEGNMLLQQRFSKSNLVVEGKVVSTERVNILPAGVITGGPPAQMVFSEHNPLLKKAIIEVSSVLSSADGSQPKMITIIYPTSQDIAWIDSPKFDAGAVGLFILEKAQTNLELKEFLNDVKGRIEGLEKNYIAISPLDFHPKSDIEQIKPMLKLNTHQPNH